jgi:hypothetical protein
MATDSLHSCSACCRCTLSRRRFLATGSAAAAGLALPNVLAGGRAGEEPVVDAASLRPRAEVTVLAAIVRIPPPYWLGWPGTSYDLPRFEREYTDALLQAGRALDVRVLMHDAPVQDAAGQQAFVERIRSEQPQGVVLVLQHMAGWDYAQTVAAAGVPLIVFAPVGTAFTGHVREFSRRQGVYVISSLDVGGLGFGLRMLRAKRRFEATRVLWIRDNARHEEVLERLGTKVRSLPRRCFNERFDRTPETAEVRSVAKRMRRVAKRVVEPAEQDLRNAARTLVTAKELLQEEGANALSMDCLGMVGSRLVPTPPCMAWSILQDVGVTAGCEADLFGAVSLLFTSYLFDKPGFINDPVPETRRNLLIASHCTCGTRLRGFAEDPVPVILRSHSESDKGVSMQVLWPKGEPVTLVRFNGPHDLILDSGVVEENVDTPPAGGCRTSFEIRMDGVRDARDVEGFHQVVFLGNHRREVEAFAQLYGITVRNSA